MQQELALNEIFFSLKKQWKWIAVSTVAGALLAFVLSAFILPKKYTSSLDLYVNNAERAVGNVNINDINASQKLVNTYIVILKNRQILEQVADNVGGITYKELANSITMSSVEQTEVLRISAETGDPQLSAAICNELAALAPGVLEQVVKAGSVEVIGKAQAAKAPSSPNTKRNTLLGAVLLLVLSCGTTILVYLLDNTVKGEEDIQQRLDLPVLGEIPSFTPGTKEVRRHAR